MLIEVAGCVLAWLGASGAVVWKLTRRPHRRQDEPAPQWDGVAIESLRLKTVDGEDIGAWYLPSEEKRTGVLIVHGLGASRTRQVELIRRIRERGHAVLAISVRAHGDSTGDSHDVGFSARHDVHAGVLWLRQHRPGCPVAVVGKSLGAAAAVFDAAESRGLVDGYFLQSPFRDLDTAVWNRVEARLPAPLRHLAYAGLRIWTPLFLPDAARTRPVDRVGDIPEDVPVVIFASEGDRLARVEEARALHERVASHGRLVTVADAPHEQVFAQCRDAYLAAVAQLLDEVEARAAASPARGEP